MAASEDAMVESNSAGMAKVLQENGGYAFFMESTTIEYQVERNCRLTQVTSQPHNLTSSKIKDWLDEMSAGLVLWDCGAGGRSAGLQELRRGAGPRLPAPGRGEQRRHQAQGGRGHRKTQTKGAARIPH